MISDIHPRIPIFLLGVLLQISGFISLPEPAIAAVMVESKEYKLIVDVGSNDLEKLWSDVLSAVKQISIGIIDEEGHNNPKESRSVYFLDTYKCFLKNNGYNLRGRDAEFTLKFRAAGPDVLERVKFNGDEKTEEDIVPAKPGIAHGDVNLRGIFSRSATIKPKRAVKTVTDLLEEFGHLKKTLKHQDIPLPEENKLEAVSDLNIRELIYKGPTINFADSRRPIPAKFTLTIWEDGKGNGRRMIAELSFKYSIESNDDPSQQDASNLFTRLQMFSWAKPMAKTKTDFVYEYKNFCR